MAGNSKLRLGKFVKGIDIVIFMLSIIGIIVIVNIVLKRHDFKYDMTSNKIFSLSDQTKKVLKGLKKQVNIVVFARSGDLAVREIKDLLEEYKNLSSQISLEVLDPDAQPAVAKHYNIKEYNTIIFESGLNKKYVTGREIFSSNYMTGEMQFNGEYHFTNAILSVAQGKQSVVYFTEGHLESDIYDGGERGFSEIRGAIQSENYIEKKLSILKEGKIPDDCSVLVILNPQKKFLPDEADTINKYLNNNGKLLVLLDVLVNSGLEKFLSEWGIQADNDIVVDVKSCFNLLFMSKPTMPIPFYKLHDITKDLLKGNVMLVMNGVRSLSKIETNGINISLLLESGKDSWGETNFDLKKKPALDKKDKKGPLSLALAVNKGGSDTKIVVIGDSDFASNNMIGNPGNKDFFLNSVNWLAGEQEKISIRPKAADIRRISKPQMAPMVFWISVIATPVIILIIGAIVWIKRMR